MADPIEGLIGDYRPFTAMVRDRLAVCGIDIAPFKLSPLAVRAPEPVGIGGFTRSGASA